MKTQDKFQTRRNIKSYVFFALITVAMLMASSCATVFSGALTEHQKTKPLPEEPKREVKWELVAVDAITFFPFGLAGVAVDFLTGAIYRPVRNEYGTKLMTKEEVEVYQARKSEQISNLKSKDNE